MKRAAFFFAYAGIAIFAAAPLLAQDAPMPALRLDIPHSDNPFHAYRPTLAPPPNLANSTRIDTLVHNGVLELSLKDAIELALENNLDLAIARYNIPIAEADIMRTRAGGSFRGVNTGVVQNTPGGGGFGSASSGASAGGTSGGGGGAGSGASGLVQSTLGTGTNVSIQRLRQTSTTSITRNRSQTLLFMERRHFSRTRRRATSAICSRFRLVRHCRRSSTTTAAPPTAPTAFSTLR